MKRSLSEREITDTYKMICTYYNEYLKHHGVKLPRLKGTKGFTKDALVLIYLAQGYPKTKEATKGELTEFIRSFYPRTNEEFKGRNPN